jgi:hypothetical protein
MKKNVFFAWTDYPLSELGDVSENRVMRPVEVMGWNGDKLLSVLYAGHRYSVHRCYVYSNPKTKVVYNPAWYYWNHLRGADGMRYERQFRDMQRYHERCYEALDTAFGLRGEIR